MFGTLRFLLALFVAVSHMSFIENFNIGVSAVIVFYILSGYVMTHSFLVNYKGDLKNVFYFYTDRFFRIYPLYLFYLILTVLFIEITNFGGAVYSFGSLLSNISIVPLNYFMFIDTNILQDPKWSLIPPAWSLGAEIQFYLIIPLVLYYRKSIIFLVPISIVIFLMATFNIINTDFYGYRILPGILFIFLIGSLLYQFKDNRAKSHYLIKALSFFGILTLLISSFTEHIKSPFTLEVLVGLILGTLFVSVLADVSASEKGQKVDSILGELSYPLFLCHFLAIWILKYVEIKYNFVLNSRSMIILQVLLSISLSYIGYRFIDRNMQVYRKKLRDVFLSVKKRKEYRNK